jgi:hypothetical protein
MTRIVFELEAIEDIKSKLDSLIQRSEKIDSTNFKKLVKPRKSFLDRNEQMVFDCIKEKDGQLIAEDVKESLPEKTDGQNKKSLSRKPIFKALKSLKDRKMIFAKPDPSNIRRLQLYLNRDNLIIQVESDIRNFKQSYFKLIKRTKKEYFKKQDLTSDELEQSKRPDLDIDEFYSIGIADDLAKIFKQLIIHYSLNAIFKWPQEIKDLESLNRLYLTVFQSLNEIFSGLVKHVPFDIQDERKRIAYLHEGLRYSFEDALVYQTLIPKFADYSAEPEFDAVMSNLFSAIKMNANWKDYREGNLDKPLSTY